MKSLKLILFLCVATFAARAEPSTKAGNYTLQEGDIVFQSIPHNPLVDLIEGATGSPYSHCGIVQRTARGWNVIEALSLVTETPLQSWIARGRAGRFTVYRLKPEYRTKIPAMLAAARTYEGLPYDIRYEFDDAKLYCSELVFKAFRKATGEALGRLQKLAELNWKPYVAIIRAIEGGSVPLDREMITPRAITEAPQLEKVAADQS